MNLACLALVLTTACPTGREGPGLRIADPEAFLAEGPRGGPFAPASRKVELRNVGGTTLAWSASLDAPWLDLDDSSGTLEPGTIAEITLSLDPKEAARLAPRTYAAEFLVRVEPKGSKGKQPTRAAKLDCLLDVRSDPWTPLERGRDSRAIHVSSSKGNDRNDGLSEGRPKKTIAAGKAQLRSGHPDWLLLKRGDTWKEPLGQWIASGRSAEEPMVIASYGEGDRPLLLTGKSNGIETNKGGPSPDRIEHLALVGIHMKADGYTGTDEPAGVAWLLGSNDVLIEDCAIEGYHTNLLVQGYFGRHSNIRVRRCVIADAFSTTQSPSSHGLYMSNTDGALIEENVFDHNGWNESVPGASPSMYRHNIYVQSGSGACTGVVVRRNILAGASSHGLQLRPGGVAYENLFLRNSIALMLGGGNEPNEGGVKVAAVRNAILDGKDIDAANPRGWGIEVFNVTSGLVSDNLIAHNTLGHMPVPIDLHGDEKGIGVFRTTVSRNVIWDWKGSVMLQGDASKLGEIELRENDVCSSEKGEPLVCQTSSGEKIGVESRGNRFHSSSTPGSWFRVGEKGRSLKEWATAVGDDGSQDWTPAYPDPKRTIATYDAELGGAGTHESFMRAARAQSRDHWREEYTARAAIDYLRAGFGMP